MKSERRHELQHNALAEWMIGAVASIKPYTNAILAVLLLTAVVAVAAVLWVQRSHGQAAGAWESFYNALDNESPFELDDAAQQYADQPAGHWAGVVAGDLHLARGCSVLFTSKPEANHELKQAVQCYEQALASDTSSALRSRATFGLARAQESLGKLDDAMKSYEGVVKNWPDTTYARLAERRLEDLKRPATKAFYDRFAKFDPRPAYSTDPGIPGQRLPFNESSLAPLGEGSLFGPPKKEGGAFPATGEGVESGDMLPDVLRKETDVPPKETAAPTDAAPAANPPSVAPPSVTPLEPALPGPASPEPPSEGETEKGPDAPAPEK